MNPLHGKLGKNIFTQGFLLCAYFYILFPLEK